MEKKIIYYNETESLKYPVNVWIWILDKGILLLFSLYRKLFYFFPWKAISTE